MKYKIGITSYDEWHELWETHIGFAGDLIYSVWGKTEQDSNFTAHLLVTLLNNYVPDDMKGRIITESK